MSFGGLGGLAGGVLIQPASIHPAGRYVAVGPSGQPDLTAPVNNVFWRKSGPGSTPPGIEDANQGAFQYISILPIAVPIVEPNFLEECTAVGGSAGTFTTAAPLFGQHGLPVNYGRGRNRWRLGDEDFINVWFRLPKVCQDGPTGGAAIMSPQVIAVAFVPNVPPVPAADPISPLGNLEISIGNIGLADIPATGTVVNMEFMHTIQR